MARPGQGCLRTSLPAPGAALWRLAPHVGGRGSGSMWLALLKGGLTRGERSRKYRPAEIGRLVSAVAGLHAAGGSARSSMRRTGGPDHDSVG